MTLPLRRERASSCFGWAERSSTISLSSLLCVASWGPVPATPVPPPQGERGGVEDNCMVRHEVSQHCCMSEIELSWRLALPPQCRDVCCYSSCGLHISILLFFSSSHIVAMLMCKTYTTDLKPGPPIIGLFHSEHSRTWGNNQNVQRKERCLVML